MHIKANANPTRRFFVDILTRDISLQWAILDLIDNSIDSFRASGRELKDCEVLVLMNVNEFKIADNAAGITVERLRNYAFSFGRKEGDSIDSGSIGLYGVGMKRAIFKMGRHFTLQTTSLEDCATMDVNVDEWLAQADAEWTFDVQVSKNLDGAPTGTVLSVTGLSESTRADFHAKAFAQNLVALASRIYCYLIEQGLRIIINGQKLDSVMPKLSFSDSLSPKVVERRIGAVSFRLVAGVYAGGEDDNDGPSDAGWTVVCNGRAVLVADKSELTGWGSSSSTRIPRFHNQYSKFRGIVEIEAADSLELPWNTTKSSLDTSNKLYKSAILPEMIAALRVVLDFLNKLKEEGDAEESPSAQVLVGTSTTGDARQFVKAQDFKYTIPVKVTEKNVQFRRPSSLVDRAVRFSGCANASVLGGKLFDEYVDEFGLDTDEGVNG